MALPDPLLGSIPQEVIRLHFAAVESRLAALEAAGELALSATPDYTATVSSSEDTSIWKGISVPGWGRIWFLTSTALAADLDTTGAIDSAGIPGSELSVGDFFFSKTNTGATFALGTFIVKAFTDGATASNINLGNINSLGLTDTD